MAVSYILLASLILILNNCVVEVRGVPLQPFINYLLEKDDIYPMYYKELVEEMVSLWR